MQVNNITLANVAEALAARYSKQAKSTHNGYQSHCPRHDDQTGSLSLSEVNGKLLVHCQAGCDQDAVWAEVTKLSRAKPSGTGKTRREDRKIVAVYPYQDAAGNAIFEKVRYTPKAFSQRRGDGNGGYKYRLDGIDTTVPYRLPAVLQAIEKGETIYVVEGEKDCDYLGRLGLCATCNAQGASQDGKKPKWTDAHTAWMTGASEIVILPDNDAAGRAHASAIAQSLGRASIPCRIVELPNLPSKGDVSDWLDNGGTCEQLSELTQAAPFVSVTAVTDVTEEAHQASVEFSDTDAVTQTQSKDVTSVTGNFRVNALGVWFAPSGDNDTDDVWICSRLVIKAATRDVAGENWGRLLEFDDMEGKTHEWSMPMELLKGGGDDYRGELLRQGLRIAPGKARNFLTTYIQTATPEVIARCVTRTGWHEGSFVLPDGTVCGSSSELIRLQTSHLFRHGVGNKGTHADWKEGVSKYCRNNSRLLFAVSAAFAAPLLSICNEESGGFNLRGISSIGKTTILKIAASVYGLPEYVKACRATANGIESTAANHNCLPLLLDEIGQADPRQIGEIIYLLANGQGKQRMDKNVSARPSQMWQTLFLLSGEKSLADYMASAGQKVTAGEEVRLIDIAADTGTHGAFEELHGHKTGAELSKAIANAAAKNYGSAGLKYVSQLCENFDSIRARYEEFQRDFINDYVENSASGQVRRAAQRFALVAFAGELATSFAVTGWDSGDAINAAANLYKDWLKDRGGSGAQERQALLSQVRHFFEMHGESRFVDLTATDERKDDRHAVINRAGFRKGTDSGVSDFYVLPETFQKELIKGHNHKWAVSVLTEENLLQPSKSAPSTTIKVNGSATRAYKFSNALLGSESSADA